MNMKVVAFFDLQEGKDPQDFLDWVNRKQAVIFESKFPEMSDFRVFPTVDEDNAADIPKMVQIFEYKGTPEDWRKTLKEIRSSGDSKISEVAREWLGFCRDQSTKIIYLEDPV